MSKSGHGRRRGAEDENDLGQMPRRSRKRDRNTWDGKDFDVFDIPQSLEEDPYQQLDDELRALLGGEINHEGHKEHEEEQNIPENEEPEW